MASRQVSPPKLASDGPYKTWKNKIEMWTSITEFPKNKQGVLVRLYSLDGNSKAEKAVSVLTATQLNVEGGLEVLLSKLDAAFKSEEVDEAYGANSSFNVIRRETGQSMLDYILEFEYKYAQLCNHNMKLPDTIQAFRLLDGAELDEGKRQLVLTIGRDLKYDSMKSALKRIFCQQANDESPAQAIIKQESAFVTYARRNGSKMMVKQINNLGQYQSASFTERLNPKDRNGNVTRCFVCDSRMHWFRSCPHKKCYNLSAQDEYEDRSEECEKVEMVLLANDASSRLDGHPLIAVTSAIVDTACSKTVAGYDWFNGYTRLLDDNRKDKIKLNPSGRWFQFGDGRKVKSIEKGLIPIQIGRKHLSLEVELVNEQIPLLLSKASLKKADTILDMKNDLVIMLGQELPLHVSPAGHYSVKILPKNGNFMAMHLARRACIQNESSENNRRALRKNTIRTKISFERGNEVYYPREDGIMWKGPANTPVQNSPCSRDLSDGKKKPVGDISHGKEEPAEDCYDFDIDKSSKESHLQITPEVSALSADGTNKETGLDDTPKHNTKATSGMSKKSPTCSKDSMRVILAIIAQKDWKLNTMGMRGFSDASLTWYQRLKNFMVSQGAKMSNADSAVFYVRSDSMVQGIVGIDVDDMLWAGTKGFEENLITSLRSTFKIGCEKADEFTYIGLNIRQGSRFIEVDQNGYINSIKPLGVGEENQTDVMKTTIGQLLWTSTQTRPDVSHDVCQLAANLKIVSEKDRLLTNKVIQRLKSQKLTLKYGKLGKDSSLKIVVYADSGYGNLEDGGSHLVFLVGENGQCSLLSWKSKRLRRVVRSKLATETLSISEAVENATLINGLFCELYFGIVNKLPMTVVTDNKSLCEALHSSKNVNNKRLKIEMAMLKEMMQRN